MTENIADRLAELDDNAKEIFWGAYKIGAVFGFKCAVNGRKIHDMIAYLEKQHPTPKEKKEINRDQRSE